MNQKTLFIVAIGLLVLGFGLAVVLYQNTQSTTGESGWGGTDTRAERAEAPVKGASDARVTIVEFFDPACGTCAQFYPLIGEMVEKSGGRVKVMLRYAPLHEGSDQVVKMLEAARQQDRFWQALELLFANQGRWTSNHRADPQRARRLLNSIAMDHARLDAAINGEEVAAAVAQDVRDAAALGVRATPEFFVNGQPLPSWGLEQLRQLVGETVAASYP